MWIEAKAIFQGLNKFCCNSEDESAFESFFVLLKNNIERLEQPLINKVNNFKWILCNLQILSLFITFNPLLL